MAEDTVTKATFSQHNSDTGVNLFFLFIKTHL